MPIKILYAEDELFLGKIVKESLESRGFEVLMEADGNKVLSIFKQQRPEICVLDIMLPNKDGYTLAREIRDIDATVPVIFLTAKTQTGDLVKGFKSGGNDYIRKPFSMEELIVRIENSWNERLQTKPQMLRLMNPCSWAALSFKGNRQLLVGGDDEKKLSFRESELLKYYATTATASSTAASSSRGFGAMIIFSTPATSMYTSPSSADTSGPTAVCRSSR